MPSDSAFIAGSAGEIHLACGQSNPINLSYQTLTPVYLAKLGFDKHDAELPRGYPAIRAADADYLRHAVCCVTLKASRATQSNGMRA
jgi:hypothetical protein